MGSYKDTNDVGTPHLIQYTEQDRNGTQGRGNGGEQHCQDTQDMQDIQGRMGQSCSTFTAQGSPLNAYCMH